MATILDQIVKERRIAVREQKARTKLAELEARISERTKRPAFAGSFHSIEEARRLGPTPAHRIISEIKRASPSRGLIRADFDHRKIARQYERGGATAISILTEGKHFQGSLNHLAEVAETVDLPLLRKDFFVDPYQVVEAKAFGASAMLLIVGCTEKALAEDLLDAADHYELAVLAEVHTRPELDRILEMEAPVLIGINNRDLHTFRVSLEVSLELLPHIPTHMRAIAESGLEERADLDRLREAGAGGFLIGESLMRATDPGEKLATLVGGALPDGESAGDQP